MEELERSVRCIVSKSDVNVVTKRMVRTEYMKQHNLVSLSPRLKTSINQVLNAIVQELTALLKQGHSLESLQLNSNSDRFSSSDRFSDCDRFSNSDRFIKSDKTKASCTANIKQKHKTGLNYKMKSSGKCAPKKDPSKLLSAEEVREIFYISDESEHSIDLCYPSRSTAETESISSGNWEEDIALLSPTDTTHKSLREPHEFSSVVREQRHCSDRLAEWEKSHTNNNEVIMIESSPEANNRNKRACRRSSPSRNWLSIFSETNVSLTISDGSDDDHSSVETAQLFPNNLFRNEHSMEIEEVSFDSEKVKKVYCGERYELNKLFRNNLNKTKVTNESPRLSERKRKINTLGLNEDIYLDNERKLKSRHHGRNLWVKIKNVPVNTEQIDKIITLN
ncbi:hypothetical protein Btru_074731 [Bulinus truncatus]|nr:hypothetical protein Btru_074731 [Bulinus truncatus]